MRESAISNHYNKSYQEFEGGASRGNSLYTKNLEPNHEDYQELDEEAKLLRLQQNIGRQYKQAIIVIQNAQINQQKMVDLSSMKLANLDFLESISWPQLEEIVLSNNQLEDIQILNKFPKLQSINASYNYIEKIDFSILSDLLNVNLENNFLTKFPQLKASKLNIINLKANQIKNLYDFDNKLYPSIRRLIISQNDLKFEDDQDFVDFINKCSYLVVFQKLDLTRNPYLEKRISLKDGEVESEKVHDARMRKYKVIVRDSLQQKTFEEFNLESLAEIKRLLDNNTESNNDQKQYDQIFENRNKQEQAAIEKKEAKQAKKQGLMTLDQLLNTLETANNQPSRALDMLKDLSFQVNRILDYKKQIEHFFFDKKKTEDETREDIESFMQNSVILIDNHKELDDIILSILAKLSIIEKNNFGLSCFTTLRDLMMSGREVEEKIQNIIQVELISKFRMENPKEIPKSVLLGLYDLVEVTQCADILTPMYEMCFPNWIKKYVKKCDFERSRGIVPPNDEHYDAVISLILASLKHEENQRLLVDKLLVQQIIEILKTSEAIHERYIPILAIITCLANNYEEVCDQFIDAQVHDFLHETIDTQVKQYLTTQSLFKEGEPVSIKEQTRKYLTFSQQIKTIGALLQSQEKNDLILDQEGKFYPVLLGIIKILKTDKVDPILLEAVCTFALDLFESDNIINDEEYSKPFFEALDNFKTLLPFLGGDKYQLLLEMSRRYHLADSKGKKVTDSGNTMSAQQTHIQESKQDSTLDQDGKKQKQVKQTLTSLGNLDDSIVNKVFISIINLMRLCCLEAVRNDVNKYFDKVSDFLNKNGREDALFNCLVVNNDDVKLAVAGCLLVIPEDELESEEISKICRQMSLCKNISAGETELIMSTFYWIVTKFSSNDPNESPSASIFQVKFGEISVLEALNILERNLERETEDEEDEQKYSLSVSILNFLKAGSTQSNMSKAFEEKIYEFKRILIKEEINSTANIRIWPIDIENTVIGNDMNALIECIQGVETIQPYCDVSFRILNKIADVLMGRNVIQFVPIDTNKNVIKVLLANQEINYQQRIKDELDYWVDLPKNFFNSMNEKLISEIADQHKFFADGNGITLLKMLLTSKYPVNEEYLQKVVDPVFQDQNQNQKNSLAGYINIETEKLSEGFSDEYLSQSIPPDLYTIRKAFYKEWEQQNSKKNQQGDEQINNEENVDEKNDEIYKDKTNPTSRDKFYNHLKIEVLGQDYLESKIDAGSNFKRQEEELKLNDKEKADFTKKEKEGLLNQKEKRFDGFLNLDHRTRNIAAFLRCLIAAIEYSVDFNTKKQAIECIHDPGMFRAITQLCDATDWDENASIGGKYLRIMRHIIQIPIEKDYEKHDMLFHYDLLAIVINRVLGKIMDKIKKDIQMTNADKFTNYELSYTLFMIVQNTCQFQFSTLDIVRLYRQNELKIEYMIKFQEEPEKQMVPKEELEKCGWALSDFEYDKLKKIGKKCTLTSRSKNEIAKEFKADLAVMLQKRQIQQQIIELMILKMFTKNTIFSLVDILFKDMSGDYQIYQESRAQAEADLRDDDEPEKKKEDGPQDEENPQDREEDDELGRQQMLIEARQRSKAVTKFEIDEEDYLDRKSGLTIERIKDIVGEILCHCPEKMVYTILEYIMKGVIFEKKYLRQSFMQEVLNSNKNAFYKIQFQKYINANYIRIVDTLQLMEYFEPQPHQLKMQERIIEMTDCDLNLTVIIDSDLEETAGKDIEEGKFDSESNVLFKNLKEFKDSNFQQRLFCLCNTGVQIFKKLDPYEVCDKCEPTQFCPRGPIPDLVILYEDIQHIVIFPQIPQKLVIVFKIPKLFKIADDGDTSNMIDKLFYIKAQLTINIPNYTKSAKIFSYLSNNMQTVRSMIKHEQIAADNFEELKGNSYKLKKMKEEIKMKEQKNVKQEETQLVVYDQIVQIQLQFSIYQIDETIEAKEINEKLLNYCSLLDTNLLSKKYLETKVKNISLQSAKKPVLQHPMFNQFNNYRFVESQMNENSVYVVVIRNNLVVLKEYWPNWDLIFDPVKVSSYKKKNKEDVKAQVSIQLDELQKTEKEPNKEKDPVGHREWDLKKYFGDLFKIILVWDLNDCNNLNVHKGKDATVELIGGDEENIMKLSLRFLGDMERQQFIDNVNDTKCGDGDDDEDDEEDKEGQEQEQQQQQDDDDDSENQQEEIIEIDEPIDPIIFD